MKYDNAEEIYEKIVTHGPLDVKIYIGNGHPDFIDPEFPADEDQFKVNMKFKGTTFCDNIPLFLGAQDLVRREFAPDGSKDKFLFDKCEAEFIEGLWFNVWSMSIKRQLEIMTSEDFESGTKKKDPIF